MKIIMYYNFVGLFCLLISMIFRMIQKDKDNDKGEETVNVSETRDF